MCYVHRCYSYTYKLIIHAVSIARQLRLRKPSSTTTDVEPTCKTWYTGQRTSSHRLTIKREKCDFRIYKQTKNKFYFLKKFFFFFYLNESSQYRCSFTETRKNIFGAGREVQLEPSHAPLFRPMSFGSVSESNRPDRNEN